MPQIPIIMPQLGESIAEAGKTTQKPIQKSNLARDGTTDTLLQVRYRVP